MHVHGGQVVHGSGLSKRLWPPCVCSCHVKGRYLLTLLRRVRKKSCEASVSSTLLHRVTLPGRVALFSCEQAVNDGARLNKVSILMKCRVLMRYPAALVRYHRLNVLPVLMRCRLKGRWCPS